MGLKTVGQVIAHLQRDNRLVVHVLIDGQEPDLNRMTAVRQSPLLGHTIFIETAEPKQMALDVLAEVEHQLCEADRLKIEAAELLQKNQNAPAMEKLSGCLSTWQHAQESLAKTGQLLRIDLDTLQAGASSLTQLFNDFTAQLRQIRSALETRDFVTLGDLLLYETNETTERWRSAISAMRGVVLSR
jgi:hypothetical protein